MVDTTVQLLPGAAGSSAVTGKGAASEMSPVPDGSKDTHLLSLPWSKYPALSKASSWGAVCHPSFAAERHLLAAL